MSAAPSMPLDWQQSDLAAGLHCYRGGRFFDAHEHWEDAWRARQGAEKRFLQALIQIAVAMHHFQQGNRVGAASLLGRALRRLEEFPSAFCGVELEQLRTGLRAWSEALEQSAAAAPPPPFIR
ncbi:MAG: DUF309 domain-containing protein [Acidobacteriota bacterium]